MKKLFLFECLVLVTLLGVCSVLRGTEKTVVQHPAGSDIETAEIKNGFLIIKSKGKTYEFKLSELIKSKSEAATTKKKNPKNLGEAFEINGEWCVFQGRDAGSNSLKYLNKLKKKPFKAGEFLQRVAYKGKYYVRDLNMNIYEPHWETGKDFGMYLITADAFVESIKKRIKILKEEIEGFRPRIPKAQYLLEKKREKYIEFLTANNIKTTIIDENGNIIKTEHSGDYDNKIKAALRSYKKSLNKLEDAVQSLMSQLSVMESELESLQKELIKIETFISGHNNSKEK